MASNKLRCAPGKRFCESFDAEHRPSGITEELLQELGAAGVGCKGPLAEYLKNNGDCGILGALMQAHSWQAIRAGSNTNIVLEAETAGQIFEGQVEPRRV